MLKSHKWNNFICILQACYALCALLYFHLFASLFYIHSLTSSFNHRIIACWPLKVDQRVLKRVNQICSRFYIDFPFKNIRTQDLLSYQNILHLSFLSCTFLFFLPRQSPGRWTSRNLTRKEILFSRNFLFISFKPFFSWKPNESNETTSPEPHVRETKTSNNQSINFRLFFSRHEAHNITVFWCLVKLKIPVFHERKGRWTDQIEAQQLHQGNAMRWWVDVTHTI